MNYIISQIKLNGLKQRRLRFLGHIARLDKKASAKVALYEAIRPVKQPQGKPSNTLLSTIKKQLKELDIQDVHHHNMSI